MFNFNKFKAQISCDLPKATQLVSGKSEIGILASNIFIKFIKFL